MAVGKRKLRCFCARQLSETGDESRPAPVDIAAVCREDIAPKGRIAPDSDNPARKGFPMTAPAGEKSKPGGEKPRVLILGGGPNRIGQGIEFDYCCCHASYAIREVGYESVMVNCNPETVSTDYDTSDRLYFEPLTIEDVSAIVAIEKPLGAIVQLGGQTPLNLAVALEKRGVKILGTSPQAIARAEDREQFKKLLEKVNLRQPENGTAFTLGEAREVAHRVGYPVVVRPSFVLGGRAMEIVYDDEQLDHFVALAMKASTAEGEHPILIDKFLEDAIEVDVDAVADGTNCVIGAIMEHVEEAGIHSGDSSCVIPPYTLGEGMQAQIRAATHSMAAELGVVGLMNVQYAVRGDRLFVLEVNPRASRTVPFVSKAKGVPLVNIATKAMLGFSLEELNFTEEIHIDHVAVKAPVFPFARFPGVDAVLGPEMRSTGEVMGIDKSFGLAFAKALQGAGMKVPTEGAVFFSIRDADKRNAIGVARELASLGLELVATPGTAALLRRNDLEVREIFKITGGRRPNIIDLVKNGEVAMIINTPSGKTPRQDEVSMRSTAVSRGIPLITTLSGAQAMVSGIGALKRKGLEVEAIQEYGQRYEKPELKGKALA
jgi:carbamoyl-phosphate synthase large subunit